MIDAKQVKEMIFYNSDTGEFFRKLKSGIKPIKPSGIKPVIKLAGKNYNLAKVAWYYTYEDESIPWSMRAAFGYKDGNPFNSQIANLVPLWKQSDTISRGRLEELFSYNNETGQLIRKYTMGGQVPGPITAEHSDGYIRVSIFGERFMLHNVMWIYHNGNIDKDNMYIDHINHDRKDNRISNLRLVSPSENAKNRSRVSGRFLPTGIDYRPEKYKNSPYVSRITSEGKSIELGRYATLSEAIASREAANVMFGFHENHGK